MYREMGSEHYCLRWNNHQSNLLGVFSQLLRDESLVDVTLACSEGHSIRAHKVVLSACSSYFQTLFIDHPSRHPIVILKDVRFSELRTLIEFMYKGEVNIEYCQLSALLKTAESLKVKGLAEMTREYKQEPEQTEPTELTKRQQTQQQSQSRPQSPLLHHQQQQQQQQDLPNSPSIDEEDESQPTTQSPPVLQNLRLCRSPSMLEENEQQPPKRSPISCTDNNDNRHLNSPVNSDCGPSDMTIHNNNNNNNNNSNNNNNNNMTTTPSCSGIISSVPTICSSRLSSPLNTTVEPLPGPSNLPPVQQVPLSLKKEVDWSANLDEKNTGADTGMDFSRHPHDINSDLDRRMDSPLLERPSSTQSSRSSTPFTLPFSALPTSLLEVGLIHPSLLGEEIFRCPSCMAAFPSIWLLEQHTALQHIGTLNNTIEKPFICDQCGQSYRYRSAYVKHREQNHRARLPADKLFSCDVCGMQFRYLKSFKKHRLNHALEKLHGKSSSSSGGGNGGVSGESLKINNDDDGGGGGNTTVGNVVDNSSDQVSSSNETIVVDETVPGGSTNDESSTIVIKKERLNDDFSGETVSSDVDKAEAAEQDDTIDSMALTFPSAGSNFDLLRNSHDPTTTTASIISFLRADTIDKQRDRRFACPFCGKCVRSKENLKLHVRKHTGERPFVCLFCGRAFGGKSDLTRHLRIHTGERPYHCDMCGKCFARADYLSKHLTTHINTTR